ncbi:hypothetical protein CGRA01v4_05418 [Colletotrichum graminicola]|nr:hypothetical protein CGRA01v4_05418 [Colletotrichum graminicola]
MYPRWDRRGQRNGTDRDRRGISLGIVRSARGLRGPARSVCTLYFG